MKIYEKLIGSLRKKSSAAAVIFGIAGLILILLSSFVSDKKKSVHETEKPQTNAAQSSYRSETEERLEAFLENIEGAGEVKVYLTVGSGERYVYASEGKHSESENKKEEEEKYVIVGGGSDRQPLIETIKTPEITGAVVICKGCSSPVVEERIYKAVSAALDIPTSDIYVTTMK